MVGNGKREVVKLPDFFVRVYKAFTTLYWNPGVQFISIFAHLLERGSAKASARSLSSGAHQPVNR
jgi:hypothetical protein